MLRIHRVAFARALIYLALGLIWLNSPAQAQPAPGEDRGRSAAAAGPPEAAQPPASPAAAPAPAPSPIYIFLKAPADLDAFWAHLTDPDFVLQKGPDYQKLVDQAKQGRRPAEDRQGVIEALSARGEVQGDLGHLTVELGISLTGSAATWIPIRLNDLTVTAAQEAERDLPLREQGDGWQVEVKGPGKHTVRVELLVPVKPTTDGKRLTVSIPEVASTEIQIDVAGRVVDAVAGPSEVVGVEPLEGAERSRLRAHLAPRPRLELTWRIEAEPSLRLPPLLTARGEISLDVDSASLQTRASWIVTAARGLVRSLDFRLDPDEELTDLALDDQPLPVETRKGPHAALVSIPLAEPLRPGVSRRVTIATRRALPADQPPRWVFRGFPLANASAQSGVVTIAQSADVWIDGTPRRGLRQIDLRELPADLRARPSTALAYQFLDQPFELALRIAPSPPHVRVESRTTARVDAGLARVDCVLDYNVTRGRVFELTIGLPKGLDLDSVGPAEVVASYQRLAEPGKEATAGQADSDGGLVLRLTPKARDDGVFRVRVSGRQTIDPSRPVRLALLQPRDATSTGSWVAVVTARNVTVDLPGGVEDGGGTGGFAPAGLQPPADWPWPADRSATAPVPALWLRHDGAPTALPLRVAVQPRTVHHETTLSARVDRRRLDVQQDTVCHVHYGTLTRLEVSVPPALEGLWDFDGDEVSTRDQLKVDADGRRHYRLTLRREVADQVRLRFRYRVPLEPALAPNRPSRLEIPWIKVVEGTASPPRMTVDAESGIRLSAEAPGWTVLASEEAPIFPFETTSRAGLTLVRSQPDAGPAAIIATARALEPLPSLLASRLWLRTVLGSDGQIRTSAWYRVEAHESSLTFALTGDAELNRVRFGGTEVTEVERLSSGAHRVRFPSGTPSGPVLVGVEYTQPATAAASLGWSPPRLVEGGLVQETFWEAVVPWSVTVLGVPPGWTDENEWQWNIYAWKRTPWKDTEALTAWLAGPSANVRLVDNLGDGRGGYHSYLFRRQGGAAVLRAWTMPRAWLVGTCSGIVLGLGVLLLIWRPSRWLLGTIAVAAILLVSAALQPSLTVQVLESAVLGVVLTVVAAGVQRLTERWRPPPPIYAEPGSAPSATSESSLAGRAEVGSDESTAIRVRPGSTRDHRPGPHPAPADPAVAEETISDY